MNILRRGKMNVLRSLKAIGVITPPGELIETVESKDIPPTNKAAVETQADEKAADILRARLVKQAEEEPALETQAEEEPADTAATLKLEEGLREIKEVVMRLENTLEQVLGSELESEPELEFTRLILDTVRKEVRKEVKTVLRTFRTLPEGWHSSNGESSDA